MLNGALGRKMIKMKSYVDSLSSGPRSGRPGPPRKALPRVLVRLGPVLLGERGQEERESKMEDHSILLRMHERSFHNEKSRLN